MVEYINTPQTRLGNSSSKNCLKYNRITNCITEIPQDIKLELNDGTLTLKAGSKVYIPSGKDSVGNNVFDYIIVPNDVVFQAGTIGDATFELILFCKPDGSYGLRGPTSVQISGETDTFQNAEHCWYDTTNNLIKHISATNVYDFNCSFPVGIYQRTVGKATGINQVFNGFGYIGSTVFALPGVKGLMPNGLNKDSTLKNISFSIPDVIVNGPFKSTGDFNVAITPSLSTLYSIVNSQYNFTRQKPTGTEWRWYNPETNKWWFYSERLGIDREDPQCLLFNHLTLSDGRVTYFEPKTSITLPDYNDLLEIKNKIQLVSALPSNPQEGVLYGIPE